ncbi:MAG: hypothetical protein QF464_01775 [Myxococcota bacterium]|nr:hypothetical protein [Myxococcota bacterium]
MNRWLAIALALTLLGCGKSQSAPDVEEKVPAPITRSPTTKPQESAAPTPKPEAPTPKPEAPAPTAPSVTKTRPLPADPVEAFAAALERVKDCERDSDGLFVIDPKGCLADVASTRERLIHPPKETAPTRKERARVGTEMALRLRGLIGHTEPTVVYYALQGHAPYFDATPETIDQLDRLMLSPLEPIAEAAAVVRFDVKDAEPKATKRIALNTFGQHTHRRVRHAACRHLGSSRYRGVRDVFKRLVAMASDGEADLLLRSCAAQQAGHVATDRSLKALTALLDIAEVQQAVIVGMQRGLATPKAIDAYVRWFERHATSPDKLHWTSMHVFLPWDTELERMPRDRSIAVLARIAGHTKHLAKVRTVAIEGLERLQAKAALAKLKGEVEASDAPEVLNALGR